MLLIVKPSENTGFGAEIFANVQSRNRQTFISRSPCAVLFVLFWSAAARWRFGSFVFVFVLFSFFPRCVPSANSLGPLFARVLTNEIRLRV